MNSEDEAILNEIKTFAEARDVYRVSPSGSEMRGKAKEKMFELAKMSTFAEAREVYRVSPFGSEMEKKAGEKMFELKPHITKMILNKNG